MPVIALIVGKAMSGAFLAHGYQANRIIALNDAGVMVHAMGKAAAARVTMRSVEDLERLAADVPPMAYDIAQLRHARPAVEAARRAQRRSAERRRRETWRGAR